MPIAFRCQSCRNKLSTAKRKAGSTVTCPGCGSEVRVPTADTLDPKVERLLATAGARGEYEAETEAATPEVEPDLPPPAPKPQPSPFDFRKGVHPTLPEPPAEPPKVVKVKRTTPAATAAKLNDLPLFEREDFAEMLEKDTEATDDDPLPLPTEAPPTAPADGFVVTRGTATMVMVAVVVLLGLAFAAGFLVGSRG
jgi:hypothetical protein